MPLDTDIELWENAGEIDYAFSLPVILGQGTSHESVKERGHIFVRGPVEQLQEVAYLICKAHKESLSRVQFASTYEHQFSAFLTAQFLKQSVNKYLAIVQFQSESLVLCGTHAAEKQVRLAPVLDWHNEFNPNSWQNMTQKFDYLLQLYVTN